MSFGKTVFILLNLIMFICLAGCATVSTTARVEVSSSSIAYHVKEGPGPTIVFQSGLGDGKSVWEGVLRRLPKSVSLFAYDRPGYGDSPSSPGPRDPCSIARELRALLRAADVRPPYVLVGHSLGGTYQFHFAKLFPEDVVGLVLLDPTHPHHWSRMQQDAPVRASTLNGLRLVAFTGVMRREFDDQEACNTDLNLSVPVSKPTSLLFSGRFRPEELGSFERMVRKMRGEWTTFFVDAVSSEASNSGHYLHKEAPDAVVEAILGIVGASKNSEGAMSR